MITDNKWIDLAHTIMSIHYTKDGHKNQIAAMLDFAEQYAKAAPLSPITEGEQGEVYRWVSVEERMPEIRMSQSDWVLVSNGEDYFTSLAVWDGEQWFSADSPHPETRVKFWMKVTPPTL